LFVSDTLVVLMIKERTSLVLAWKLHLQWLRGVFCVSMAIFGPYEALSVVHHRLMILVETRMNVMASHCLGPHC
jgi:hypothetical protein